MKHGYLLSLLALLLATSSSPAAHPETTSARQADIDFFESHIRPLLTEHCLDCHGAGKDPPEGGLRLDSRAGWLAGGDSGPAIVAGDPQVSRLVRAIRYGDTDLQMPPDGKLDDRQIADLVRWVKMGAPDPRTDRSTTPRTKRFDVTSRRQAHWAWQPIEPLSPPATRDRRWPRNPVDAFVLNRLEASALTPGRTADRRVLIRRVTFDLLGLPPTPQEITTFLADTSPASFPRLIDRLLASPHFGERWGQHWLDLVRFAETRGHEQDFPIPEAYRYRDYIIRAINQDVPYDELVIEHLAGDLVSEPRLDLADRTDQSIQGTGFWHLGEATHSPVDIRGDEADRVHNQIDVFSRTFLALSVGCARCHDHKFDAISARDYYALFGYLQSSSFQLADVSDPMAQQVVATQLVALRAECIARILSTWAACRLLQLEGTAQGAAAKRGSIESARAPARLVTIVDASSRDHAGSQLSNHVVSEAEPNAVTSPAFAAYLSAACRQMREESWDRSLQADTVATIAAYLGGAAKHPRDPLHAVGLFALRADLPDTAKSASLVKNILIDRFDQIDARVETERQQRTVVWNEKVDELHYASHERPWTMADVVEDFGACRTATRGKASSADSQPASHMRRRIGWGEPDRWIVSGHRFGRGPACAGTVLLGSSRDRPLAGLLENPAAVSDLLSTRLTGLLRTGTFEVVGDTLWYRFRGQADCFLAVDSHRVVEGPLHRVVRQRLKGDDRQWTWHAHQVRDYLGHRVHVEFTPGPGFAIDRIEFSGSQPPDAKPINRLIRRMVRELPTSTSSSGIDSLANGVTHMLAESVRACRDDTVTAADIDLVNWLIDHAGLFEAAPTMEQAVADAWADYVRRKAALEKGIPQPVHVLALLDGSGEDEPVHIRGNHKNRSSEPVPRAMLTALRNEDAAPIPHGSGRLELARQMVEPANPLVARVIVNRLWHHLFGRGIVATVDDFGVLGERPTHPRLLDHLAHDLVSHGWSLKRVIRRLVLTQTYRMSSHPDRHADTIDPDNRLLHRMPIRRLPAEVIRDHILTVSGRLDRRMFGKSVAAHITPFMRGHRSPPGSGPIDGAGRRSIYVEVRRNHLTAMLVAFDKPIPFTTVGRRNVSNGPAQALVLLNDPFVHQQAKGWAERLCALPDPRARSRLRVAYGTAFGREPTDVEMQAAIEFLGRQREAYHKEGTADPDRQVWNDLCHTLMNVKEFIYVY